MLNPPFGRLSEPLKNISQKKNRLGSGFFYEGNIIYLPEAVAGLITLAISIMELAGKPPLAACSLINSGLVALYTQ